MYYYKSEYDVSKKGITTSSVSEEHWKQNSERLACKTSYYTTCISDNTL